MKNSARAIVIKDSHILLIKRNKFGKQYYTLPGGRIEVNETAEAAAVRETLEETTIIVDSPKLVFIENAGDSFGMQYVFLCDYISGAPALSLDSEEAKLTHGGKNTYQPVWLELGKLDSITLVSPILKSELSKALKEGFPNEPRHLKSAN